jgi:hypothetical protein
VSGEPELTAPAPAGFSSTAQLSDLQRLSKLPGPVARADAALMIMNRVARSRRSQRRLIPHLIGAAHARATAPQGIEEGEEVADARFCSQYCWAVGSSPI